ncbi:hypothetical protein POM88_037238 [Heracleum sosnowskyi]|uniref:Uncharacterized protein n=1 Tax=Heracleum sosnowskyi TaxID=360622 RepID=A0AAD8MF28_9APIA|nr:hypothetical protein POM88_037238 [Heracleum sosnowskyi]
MILNLLSSHAHLISRRWFTLASPTLFNVGTQGPKCVNCLFYSVTKYRIASVQFLLRRSVSCNVIVFQISCRNWCSVHDIHAARIYSRGTDGSSNNTVLVAEFPVTSTVKILYAPLTCLTKVTAHSYYLHKNIDIYHYPIETARSSAAK